MAFMKNLGPFELIIILVIAILIFGPGRIARIGSELGKGIRGFREGVKDENADTKDDESSEAETAEDDTKSE